MFKDENRHYSLRKLSVGLASVLIGISFVSGNSHTVKADTVKDDSNGAQTVVQTTAKANAEFIPKEQSQTPEVVKKNFGAITQDIRQKAVKASEAIAKRQNNTGMDNSDETTVNAKGSKANAESTPKEQSQTSEVVKKNSDAITQDIRQKAVKASEAVTKVQNNTVKDNSDETALNTKGSKTTATNILKEGKTEVKENQDWTDPAKNKLQMSTLKTTANKKLNAKMLAVSKAISQANDTNGGFDSSWGKLDVNDWKGSVQGDYYQLTDYTGDVYHVIVPNDADFAKAGISTSGKQVGVTSDLMHTIFRDKTTAKDATVAFSKTDNKQVKAIDNDWSYTWNSQYSNGAKLSKFDGTNLDVSNVTDMSFMFGSNNISDISSLANWNTNNVTNMHSMFYDNYQIRDISSLVNWKVDNVTNMNRMFFGNNISDLSPLANWNTGKVTDMSGMFNSSRISNLSPLANWKVNKVTDMKAMFIWNEITDLSPLTSWKTDNVTNMSYMFDGNQISDLNPLANWKVDKVTSMLGMFDNNVTTQTKTIQAKRVINFVYPDGYTGKKQDSVTQTVDVPQKVNVRLITKDSKPSNNILDWATKKEIPEDPDPVYFQDYTVPEIKGLLESDKTVISKQQANANKPINVTVTYTLVASNTNDAFALDSKNGLHEHANVNDNGGYDADFWGKINVNNWNYTVNGDTIEINGLKYGVSTGANDAVIVPNLDDFKLAGKDGGAKTVYISKGALGEINAVGNATAHKYYGLSKTNGGKFVTDSDLNNAFYDNSNLTHADLNSLNTGNVTDMSGMFFGTSSLTSLDVSNWDTGNVTDMEAMFGGTSVKDLDVSNWNTGKVTDMGSMFQVASNLTSLDVSKWNTGKVTNMRSMFSETSSLTSLDVSKWNTGNVTDMIEMFDDASSLTSLDVSNWNTGNVTDMREMFFGASRLTNLDVSNWDTGNVTDMSQMFSGASSLTSLDVSKWNTGNVTGMSEMFFGASSLTSLDVSKWNTGSVAAMRAMFFGASSLTSLDVSNWDTGNVIDMSYMFNNNSNLALIVNGNSNKFADYLVKNNFADSNINSDVKSVTTDNTKLLQLLTNDVQHNSATRTIVFAFPANYSPDLTKYHLTKTSNTYQIKQSADYDTSYAQGTVLINATDDITKHHIDTTKPYKLSDTWQPNYDKLVLAHKNADGTVSFDKVQLPKVPGYKAKVTRNNGLLMVSYLVFAPEKPATNNNLNELQFSNKLATNSTIQFNSAVKSDIVVKSDMYQVVNNDHNWQLPVIKSYDLKFVTNKNQIIFAYTKDKQYNYRFVLTFKDGQYRLTTFNKQGKLLKTYLIKSYKKLVKIIHSLVAMNIA